MYELYRIPNLNYVLSFHKTFAFHAINECLVKQTPVLQYIHNFIQKLGGRKQRKHMDDISGIFFPLDVIESGKPHFVEPFSAFTDGLQQIE